MMQIDNTGKLDKSKCKIMMCEFSNISHIFKEFHYKSDNMGGGISVCFAMFIGNKLVGGRELGNPGHEKRYES